MPAVMKPNHPLEQLRASLAAPSESFLDPTLYARLAIVEADGLLHVDFCGSPLELPYTRLCEVLSDRAVAGSLASISLRSPDEGANGTCNWDLGELVGGELVFRALRSFSIQQNAPGEHNRRIVAASHEEAGVLGRLLRKAPLLESLVVPSAPDGSFFTVSDHPLRHLSVDAGYDTQDFIAHLAASHCFPALRTLEFGEYNETYLETFPQGCTPMADYQRLFLSEAFASVKAFTWRNPVCTDDEIAALRALRPGRGLQLKVVRTSSRYVTA